MNEVKEVQDVKEVKDRKKLLGFGSATTDGIRKPPIGSGAFCFVSSKKRGASAATDALRKRLERLFVGAGIATAAFAA